jgi:serine/threonine protein kinase
MQRIRWSTRHRHPRRHLRLSDIARDADPFLHEVYALERISTYCPLLKKPYFPVYHGAVKLKAPNSGGETWDSIVMGLFQNGLSTRCLLSTEISPSSEAIIADLQKELPRNLPCLEECWYREVFLERLKRLAVLHSMSIIHGDVKNDCFQIPGSIHDVALFDSSLSYPFTSKKPLMKVHPNFMGSSIQIPLVSAVGESRRSNDGIDIP